MAVDFEKPPSKLAGLFIPFGSPDDAEVGFMGVMAVSVSTWSAIAAGMYMENNSDHLKSLFVFGAIRGPILTVGSVDATGLTVQRISLPPFRLRKTMFSLRKPLWGQPAA